MRSPGSRRRVSQDNGWEFDRTRRARSGDCHNRDRMCPPGRAGYCNRNNTKEWSPRTLESGAGAVQVSKPDASISASGTGALHRRIAQAHCTGALHRRIAQAHCTGALHRHSAWPIIRIRPAGAMLPQDRGPGPIAKFGVRRVKTWLRKRR